MNLSFDVKRFLACVGPKGVTVSVEIGVMSLLLDPTSLTSRVECVHLFVRESTARTRHKAVVSAQRKIMLGAGTRNFRLYKSRYRFSCSAIFSIGGPTILC